MAAAMPQHPLELQAQALKAEYEAIGPQLSALGLNGLKDIGINLDSLVNLGATPLTHYSPIDLATLKANGYGALAVRLENAGSHSLEAGQKGLIALKKVIDSGLTDGATLAEANQVALEASDIGLKALAALPKPESLKPGTIVNLRSLGLNAVADSLVGVRRGLVGGDKASKFLKALSVLGDDKVGEAAVSTYDGLRTEVATPYVAAAPVAPSPIATGRYSFPHINGNTINGNAINGNGIYSNGIYGNGIYGNGINGNRRYIGYASYPYYG